MEKLIFWRPPANVGPPEIHESVDDGASALQMYLLGPEHHPKCTHYEWGPCICKLLVKVESVALEVDEIET